MTGFSKFISVLFLALSGRKRIDQRDYYRASRFLSAALEEKKLNADRLAPRLKIEPADLPPAILESLASEASERASRREADGVARWRSLFPEIIGMADSVDDYLRGSKVRDDRVRAVLEFHRV
jgi:hypothetical protein